SSISLLFDTLYILHLLFSIMNILISSILLFFFNDPATTEIYTLSLHDALPISILRKRENYRRAFDNFDAHKVAKYQARKIQKLRSEEHTSELQSLRHLVCRLLLEKKKKKKKKKKKTKNH